MITDLWLFIMIFDLGKATSCWKPYLDMLKELIYMMFCQKHPYVKPETRVVHCHDEYNNHTQWCLLDD